MTYTKYVPYILIGLGILSLGFLLVPANLSVSGNMVEDSELLQTTSNRGTQVYGNLPLYFETNQGQTDAEAKFLARGMGYTLFLTPTEMVLALKEVSEAK